MVRGFIDLRLLLISPIVLLELAYFQRDKIYLNWVYKNCVSLWCGKFKMAYCPYGVDGLVLLNFRALSPRRVCAKADDTIL